MSTHKLFSRGFCALAVAAAAWIALSDTASAGLLRPRFIDSENAALASAGVPVSLTSAMYDPSCCAPVPVCCPQPCITYQHRGLCKVKCCGCEPPVKTVLNVTNPCTCCPVAIPVCLPSCCTGCPDVNARGALFGDGVVSYNWCCGVRVTVRFKHCGDVVVTYHHA
jgi:hypothetical protein